MLGGKCGCCGGDCVNIKFNNWYSDYPISGLSQYKVLNKDNALLSWDDPSQFTAWYWDHTPWWQSFTGTSARLQSWRLIREQIPEMPITTVDENGIRWWSFEQGQINVTNKRAIPNSKNSLKLSLGITSTHEGLGDFLPAAILNKSAIIKTTVVSEDGEIFYDDNGRYFESSSVGYGNGVGVGQNSNQYYNIEVDISDISELPETLTIYFWVEIPERSQFVDEELERYMADLYESVFEKQAELSAKYPEDWDFIRTKIGEGYGAFYYVFWGKNFSPAHPDLGDVRDDSNAYGINNGWVPDAKWYDGLWDHSQFEDGYQPPLRRFFLDKYVPLYEQAEKNLQIVIDTFGKNSSEYETAKAEFNKYKFILDFGDLRYEADSILATNIVFQINEYHAYINSGGYNRIKTRRADGKFIWVDRSTETYSWDRENYPQPSYMIHHSFRIDFIFISELGWTAFDYTNRLIKRKRGFLTRSQTAADIYIDGSVRSIDKSMELGWNPFFSYTYKPIHDRSPLGGFLDARTSSYNDYWRGASSIDMIYNRDIDGYYAIKIYNVLSDGKNETYELTHFIEGNTQQNKGEFNTFSQKGNNIPIGADYNTGEFIIEIITGEDALVEVEIKCPEFSCVDDAMANYLARKAAYNQIISKYPLDHPIWARISPLLRNGKIPYDWPPRGYTPQDGEDPNFRVSSYAGSYKGSTDISPIEEIIVELESEDYSLEIDCGFDIWLKKYTYFATWPGGGAKPIRTTTEYVITPIGWKFEREEVPSSEANQFSYKGVSFEKIKTVSVTDSYFFPGNKFNGKYVLTRSKDQPGLFEYVFGGPGEGCFASVGNRFSLNLKEGRDVDQIFIDRVDKLYTYVDPAYNKGYNKQCGIYAVFNAFWAKNKDIDTSGKNIFDFENDSYSGMNSIIAKIGDYSPEYQPHLGINCIAVPAGQDFVGEIPDIWASNNPLNQAKYTTYRSSWYFDNGDCKLFPDKESRSLETFSDNPLSDNPTFYKIKSYTTRYDDFPRTLGPTWSDVTDLVTATPTWFMWYWLRNYYSPDVNDYLDDLDEEFLRRLFYGFPLIKRDTQPYAKQYPKLVNDFFYNFNALNLSVKTALSHHSYECEPNSYGEFNPIEIDPEFIIHKQVLGQRRNKLFIAPMLFKYLNPSNLTQMPAGREVMPQMLDTWVNDYYDDTDDVPTFGLWSGKDPARRVWGYDNDFYGREVQWIWDFENRSTYQYDHIIADNMLYMLYKAGVPLVKQNLEPGQQHGYEVTARFFVKTSTTQDEWRQCVRESNSKGVRMTVKSIQIITRDGEII